MSLKLQGKITEIGPREEKSKAFTIRKFSMDSLGSHSQPVGFQLTQDRCDIMDNYQVGDVVTVWFDVRGNVWEGKIINNLNAWKVDFI